MIPNRINRDLLPAEVHERKKVLKKISSVFEAHGFQEIVTPTFEDYDVLKPGLPYSLRHIAYRFFDHAGLQLALRPDITTQVARVVATKMKEETSPIRLYYSGDVYRTVRPEVGVHNQFHQIGVELYGAGKAGDTEILAIAEEALAAIGLKGFMIEKTNVQKIQALSPEQQKALHSQDFVALGRLPTREELMSMDIEYYTGLYFECFIPEFGYILGSGGRYDKLCGAFGRDLPAVGFAFNLDKLMMALQAQKRRK
jgi:ATP phosphoribosyltransferase regulatory subunit